MERSLRSRLHLCWPSCSFPLLPSPLAIPRSLLQYEDILLINSTCRLLAILKFLSRSLYTPSLIPRTCQQFQPDPKDTAGKFAGVGSFGDPTPDAETDGNYRCDAYLCACECLLIFCVWLLPWYEVSILKSTSQMSLTAFLLPLMLFPVILFLCLHAPIPMCWHLSCIP